MAIIQLPDGRTVDTNQPVGPTAGNIADWANQREQVGQSFANSAAQIAAAKSAAEGQLRTDLASLTQKYATMRENLPTGYAKRGLLNSGIYHTGLQNYAIDKANAFGKLANTYLSQQGQLAAQAAGAYGNYITGQNAVNRAEYAQRADLAAALRNIQ